MRQAEALRDARRDRDRPVDPGGEDSVDVLRAGESIEALLVLGRDEGPPVGELEAGRRRVAVARDHEEAALARGPKKTELRGPGA